MFKTFSTGEAFETGEEKIEGVCERDFICEDCS